MKRWHLVELEDLSWWPRVFRDATTDYLVTVLRAAKLYDRLAPRLADAIKRTAATQIVDLCSGAGGPWPTLLPALRANGVDVPICLTDKYPNTQALSRVAATTPGIRFEAESVSATEIPAHLTGFRTIFTAFHHFRPADAKAILAAAVRDRQGIFIGEVYTRSVLTLATMPLVPLAVWIMTPAVRPFRWSRLLWTYLIPVIPIAILFDGIVSCLRTYKPAEMQAMGEEVGAAEYEWEAGAVYPSGSLVPTPYLIGVPRCVTDKTRNEDNGAAHAAGLRAE